jgi:hypothetical protein
MVIDTHETHKKSDRKEKEKKIVNRLLLQFGAMLLTVCVGGRGQYRSVRGMTHLTEQGQSSLCGDVI